MKTKPLKLQIGLQFKTAWKGCLQPKQYKVVDISLENNTMTVLSKKLGEHISRYNPPKQEIWPNIDRLHIFFELGDYCLV